MFSTRSFSFLVTTDNHMGYREDDHIRRKDSYRAFKEALQIAREKDVDFILLGGDLFHYNRPSPSVEHKCIKIIREHMNASVGKATSFARIEGEFSHFHRLNHANFEDANFKVPYPIMTIHGNHDDPTGPNAQSICEKLATCGLLNYFGAANLTKGSILIKPIIFQKGEVKIALYGLGFIPDYKLKIAFDNGEVSFSVPPLDTFNVLVVHQNRVPFVKCKYIPDDLFPDFFHLIIRGHEHTAQAPELLPESKVKGLVYQPGSTVATSISTMEAAPKNVCHFTVKLVNPAGDRASRYKIEYNLIELKCCRRMLFKDVSQREIMNYIKNIYGSGKITSAEFQVYSKNFISDCIKKMLQENAEQQRKLFEIEGKSGKSTQFGLPLLRVRIEYCAKKEQFDDLEISSLFYPNCVANKDIILFRKQKLKETDGGQTENVTFNMEGTNDDDEEEDFECVNLEGQKRDTIDEMIEDYFKNKPENLRLQALSLTEYTNAVRGASEDANVISKVLNRKKQEIFNNYKRIIADEQLAGSNFHDEHSVKDWFIRAFGSSGDINTGGDDAKVDMDIVCID